MPCQPKRGSPRSSLRRLARTTEGVSTSTVNGTSSFSQCIATVTDLSVGSSNRYDIRSSNSAGCGFAVTRSASSFSS